MKHRGPHKFHVRCLGKLDGFSIYSVDGEKIRREIDTDFTMGGNSARYRYVPRGEIWIDQNLSESDAAATTVHEIVEWIFMKDRGFAYEEAHDKATQSEARFRKVHPIATLDDVRYWL